MRKPQPPVAAGPEDELTAAWRIIYETQSKEIDHNADHGGADWQSLCVGWCIGKGLSVSEAYNFYQRMVANGLF